MRLPYRPHQRCGSLGSLCRAFRLRVERAIDDHRRRRHSAMRGRPHVFHSASNASAEYSIRSAVPAERAARSKATLTFTALVGAMSLARAVSDGALSHEILNTISEVLKKR
jgi:hypothetical protein